MEEMDVNALKEYLNQINGVSDEFKAKREGDDNSFNWYNLSKKTEEGVIRFLPPWEGSKIPGIVVRKHWQIPEHRTVYCFKTYGLDCPMCSMLKEYEHKTSIEDFVPSAKSFFNVIVRSDGRQGSDKDFTTALNKNAILTTNGTYWLEWLINHLIDPVVGNITDVKDGHDVKVCRERAGGKFERTVFLKPSPVMPTESESADVVKGIIDLKKIWRTPDDQYVQHMNEAVKLVRDVLENRILVPPNADQALDKSMAAPVSSVSTAAKTSASSPAESTTTTQANAQATPPTTSAKPEGAPECFADKSIYNADDDKCVNCPHEFFCEEAIGKLG